MADHLLPTIEVRIPVRGGRLLGDLSVPREPVGVVVFAHGSGSSRFSPRNRSVARRLQAHGLATLLVDLLTPIEEAQDRRTAHLRFDIELLTRRVESTISWVESDERLRGLGVGLFGASTGAAAALAAAAHEPELVAAVVSRGGRPDLAGPLLGQVQAPTLLIVGSRDGDVIDLNQQAARQLHCTHRTSIVPGAGHLFEEPGTLDRAAELAAAWFVAHLSAGGREPEAVRVVRHGASGSVRQRGPFTDRAQAGDVLARAVAAEAAGLVDPIVLALPRGGVEVAVPVAAHLHAPLDVVVSRKVGAPTQPELAIGAVDEEGASSFVDQLVHALRLSPRETGELVARARALAARSARKFRDGRPLPAVAGHDVLLVDDGYATGMTAIVAARLLRRHGARRIILAVPVGPRQLLHDPPAEFDLVVCPYVPEPFRAVGLHYARFDQVTDQRVHELLDRTRVGGGTAR